MTDTAVESVATLSAEDVALMMRQIRDANSRMAEERATCERLRDKLDDELRMIDAHEERATKEDALRVSYLTAQLEAHLLNKRAAGPGVKSIATPWGRIESREQQPEFVKDDAALLEWALVYDDFVRMKTTTTIDWERLKAECHVRAGQLITSEGEVVPGVTVTERPLKVVVKVIE